MESGAAFEKFLTLVEAQGGDISIIEHPERYPKSQCYRIVGSDNEGYIHSVDALKIGLLAMEIGAGRKKISDQIDYSAGIILHKKIGDPVFKGDLIVEIFSENEFSSNYLEEKIHDAIDITDEIQQKPSLILKYINNEG